jgi:RNA polymerase sigma-70 factor (ECF subfamily)
MVRLLPNVEANPLGLQRVERDEEATRREELKLLLAVLRGERQAEEAFVERYTAIVEYCVRALSRNRGVSEEDIEDIVSEVWLSLWEKEKHRLRRFDPTRRVRVSTWVGTLARHKTIDWLRARQPAALSLSTEESWEPSDTAPPPEELLERRQAVELARLAVEQLSQQDRGFLEVLCSEEQGSEELARQLGIAVTTVYTRRFKIAQKLTRLVAELAPDRRLN